MNDKNLVPISSREAREIKQMGKKGGKNSVIARRKKKEEAKQNEKLVDILKIFYHEQRIPLKINSTRSPIEGV